MTSMIEDLLDPASLPDRTDSVTLVQTHISSVIVADEFVYKIKKAVNFGFLDFSTLHKREHYCRQEVTLNQRLAKDIYLDVLPVRYDGKRHRIGGGEGKTLDYAVRMRKIPDKVLMKSLFQEGRLRARDLKAIALVLAWFHRNAEGSMEIDAFGKAESFKVNTDENFQQTKDYVGRTIEEDDYGSLKTWTERFYTRNQDLFLDRITKGKIRDCHGDLHMEHICLTDPVSVIDCIEFNDRFRYSDTISDIAFLLMDLEYHGGIDLAAEIWGYYAAETGERDVEALLTFYKVYRAYVRGKVNSFQFDDGQLGAAAKEQAALRARRYFQLARSYIR